MNRKICISDGEINMLLATEADRSLIYNMSIENPDIILSMFDNLDEFKWEYFRDEKNEFFDEKESLNNYLIIQYNNEIVGFFIHIHHLAPIDNEEFHIWFISRKHTGKGLGTRVVTMMKNYIHEVYGIKTFMMRPWIKNPQAIRTYEKCGFKIEKNFDLNLYFTPDEIKKDGNGAYSVEETVNMIAIME